MKTLVYVIAFLMIIACDTATEDSKFTGREATYALVSGSDYDVNGTVVFKETKSSSTEVTIKLNGTEGNTRLPVHLHMGDVSELDAAVALVLSPVNAQSGISVTTITHLADETKVDFEKLMKIAACIKIHLTDTGAAAEVILAAGNIGAISNDMRPGLEIGVCKSK